jgi:two-component system, sensor histidine kinase PdtaS
VLRQKEALLQRQDVLSKEADHRLLNGMQMIVSLLSLQSRLATNDEVASHLADASNRVAMIESVHRHLHRFDGETTAAFKPYLEDLCRDFSTMLSWDEHSDRSIAVEGIEINLPATSANPLGFIANELITNAAKHGKGRIIVRLEQTSKGYALSVLNDGPSLPDGFDPSACKGLGMKIIRSLVGQMRGALQFGSGDNRHGTRFTVLFS